MTSVFTWDKTVSLLQDYSRALLNCSFSFGERLAKNSVRMGATLDALALAAALSQPWADIVLSGAATVEQLRSNVTALKVTWDPQAEELLNSLVESPNEYWDTRARLPWN